MACMPMFIPSSRGYVGFQMEGSSTDSGLASSSQTSTAAAAAPRAGRGNKATKQKERPQDELAPIHVYVLENMANGRCYVGQATSLSTRFVQHRRKPPTRMANDAALHVPFEQYFVMSDLGIVFGKAAADRAEG
ncbi:TPA: hypothetical protein ACH3X1_000341 [Trebouxia sp. C0004]